MAVAFAPSALGAVQTASRRARRAVQRIGRSRRTGLGSRFRLRDYHAASFDEARQLLPHARLASPGTRATVESCVSDFIVPRLINAPDDAIGVIIVTGPLHDQRGWVLGTDVRLLHPH